MTTKRDYNSIANQHIKGMLVQREVYYCQTSLVEELLSNIADKGEESPLTELDNFWYYRLDLSDGEFIGDPEDLEEKITEVETKIAEFEDRMSEVENTDNIVEVNELATKISNLEDDLQEMDEPETEAAEIFEWWLISDHLARKLKEKSQVIWEDYGCTWWGRQTTGQAILLDHVISMIAEDMEILQGIGFRAS